MLLFTALGLPGGVAFQVGYVAGLVNCLVSLRWLLHIPFPSEAVKWVMEPANQLDQSAPSKGGKK